MSAETGLVFADRESLEGENQFSSYQDLEGGGEEAGVGRGLI